MKQKSSIKVVITACICCFFIANRFSLIFLHYPKLPTIDRILKCLSDFFPSFSYLGFNIGFDSQSILLGLIGVSVGYIAYMYYMLSKRYIRPEEEHGSSRYGHITEEAGKLTDETEEDRNMILSDNINITLNTRQTFLNANVCVIGGSGSGKTRYFVKPNLMQYYCNYVITDPKGALIPEAAHGFIEHGYDVKIFDTVHMDRSMHFNPYKYFRKPNDVLKFINNLVENTSDQAKKAGGDEFFTKSEVALMTAIAFFQMAVGKEDEKNIPTLMDLIDLAEASEEDENQQSPLDVMFSELEDENKRIQEAGLEKYFKNSYRHLAVRQYSLYKKAAGKTAKSILISVGVRMAIFNIPELREMLTDDELNLETIGKPKLDQNGDPIKSVLFCTISDSDSTFSFLASILYQLLFDELYLIADEREEQCLPIHTRFILDEFANVSKIPDFERKIATMRSREISVAVILQNIAQLKGMYKDDMWETIFGNCDTTLFLGGKEFSTLEYISKFIGKTTVNYTSYNQSFGTQAGWSKSNQIVARDLLDPAEIGKLKPDECLVHVRGHEIYRDKKYNLHKHKNIDFTTDSKDKEKSSQNRFTISKVENHVNKNREEIRNELNLEDLTTIDASFNASNDIFTIEYQ